MTSKETSSEYINRISREYGLYVLGNRGIPALDGLKSGQRIALWLMRNREKEVKTLSLIGSMIESTLYVHGDKSAGETINWMAAPFLNNYPLVDGLGTFGSRVSPDKIGAPRYTGIRRSKFSEKHLYTDLDILPMVENYDGSALMPGTFLPKIPIILLNGIAGLATGWSTKILPRKLEDVQEAVRQYLKTGKIKNPLLPYYRPYDVTVVPDAEQKNRYIIKGRIKIVNTSTVMIAEIPPDMALTKFVEHLYAMEDANKINSFTDRSTKTIQIEVKLPRSVLAGKSEDALIEYFGLRQYATERIVVIDRGNVRQFESAHELVREFVDWRLGWYLTRYEYLALKEEEDIVYLRTFLACFRETPRKPSVASRIPSLGSKNALQEAIRGAVSGVSPPDAVLDRISSLPVYKWTQEGQEEAKEKLQEALTRLDQYNQIIASPERRKQLYLEEVS